jgi:pimeloyl-ACP methyl ester carboxylesterase
MPTYQRNVNYLEEQADFFITLLDHLNIQHCIALGHSDGGSIALIAASKYPERFSAIITEGAHVFVEPVTLAGIRQAVHDIEHTDLKPKLIKHHGNKTNDVVLAWSTIWLSEPFIKWNIEHFLPQIKCPALILQGENDEFGTGKQVVAIEEKIPKAKSFIIPEAGHTPHKSHPEVFLNEVNHFLLHLSVD